MASVTATRSGIAAASSTVADPAAVASRCVVACLGVARAHGRLVAGTLDGVARVMGRAGSTASPDPEQGPHLVQDLGEEAGDGPVARPGQGECGDGGGNGSYQT
jgi:hypothetical protein